MPRSKFDRNGYAIPPRLIQAVKAQDEALCRSLIASGVDINERGPNGLSALMVAIKDHGDMAPEIALALIELGADTQAIDDDSACAIHMAAECPSQEIFIELVRRGVDVNLRTKMKGETPLHYAAGKNKGENVKLLLSLGAEINALSLSKRTPLHKAAASKGSHSLLFLLMAGAEPNLYKRSDLSPLNLATNNRMATSSAILVAFGANPVQAMDEHKGMTMRQAAVCAGIKNRLIYLLDQPMQDPKKDNIKALCKLAMKSAFPEMASVLQSKQASDAIDQVMKAASSAAEMSRVAAP